MLQQQQRELRHEDPAMWTRRSPSVCSACRGEPSRTSPGQLKWPRRRAWQPGFDFFQRIFGFVSYALPLLYRCCCCSSTESSRGVLRKTKSSQEILLRLSAEQVLIWRSAHRAHTRPARREQPSDIASSHRSLPSPFVPHPAQGQRQPPPTGQEALLRPLRRFRRFRRRRRRRRRRRLGSSGEIEADEPG